MGVMGAADRSDLPPLNGVDTHTMAILMRSLERSPEHADMSWRATVTWTGGLRSESRVRHFDPIVSDEPEAIGGTDEAPNPVEQLLAALGNCYAVGYAVNASLAGIEIRSLEIDLEGDLDLDVFIGVRPGQAGFRAIRANVRLDADADADALQVLHETVIGGSPVGHTLTLPVPVRVTFD